MSAKQEPEVVYGCDGFNPLEDDIKKPSNR